MQTEKNTMMKKKHIHTENNKDMQRNHVELRLFKRDHRVHLRQVVFYNRESVSYGKRYDLNNCTAFVMLHEPSALD